MRSVHRPGAALVLLAATRRRRESQRLFSAGRSPTSASRSPACAVAEAACSSWSRRGSASRSRCSASAAPSITWSASAASRTCACSPTARRSGRRRSAGSWCPSGALRDHASPANRGLPGAAIRRAITERFGATPSTNRVDEMVVRLQRVLPRPRLSSAPTIAAARRARTIRRPRTSELRPDDRRRRRARRRRRRRSRATPLDAEAEVVAPARLAAGPAVRQVALDARIAALRRSTARRGYYEARVRESRRVRTPTARP